MCLGKASLISILSIVDIHYNCFQPIQWLTACGSPYSEFETKGLLRTFPWLYMYLSSTSIYIFKDLPVGLYFYCEIKLLSKKIFDQLDLKKPSLLYYHITSENIQDFQNFQGLIRLSRTFTDRKFTTFKFKHFQGWEGAMTATTAASNFVLFRHWFSVLLTLWHLLLHLLKCINALPKWPTYAHAA